MNKDLQLQMMAAAITLMGFTAIVGVACTATRDTTDTTGESGYGITTAVREESAPAPAAEPASWTVTEPAVNVPLAPPADTFAIDPALDPMKAGAAAYGARRWDEAIAYLTAETARHPDRGYGHYLLGLSLWKAGRLDEAADAIARAAELSPGFVKAHVNLSRIENDRGAYEAALDAARAALGVAPDDPVALFLEARSLCNLDRSDEALASLERSLGIDPDNGYAQNLYGLILLETGHADQALEPLRRAAALVPDVAYVRNNLGMALELTGSRDEAAAEYRAAVELDPGHERAAANLARLESLGVVNLGCVDETESGDGEAVLVAGSIEDR